MLNAWCKSVLQEFKEGLLGRPCGLEISGKASLNQLYIRKGQVEDVLRKGYRGQVMKERMCTVCLREQQWISVAEVKV